MKALMVLSVLGLLVVAGDVRGEEGKPAFKSVAVLPLKTKGRANTKVVEVLDDLLVTAVQASVGRGTRVITQADINTMLGLEKSKELVGCTELACTAEIAGALGVDAVVSGSLGVLGKKHTLSLALIDQNRAQVLARQSVDLGEHEDAFDKGVERGAKLLLGVNAATETVTSVPRVVLGAATNLPAFGGTGGDAMEVSCGAGSAVIGLRGAGRTPLWGLGAECGKPEVVLGSDGKLQLRTARSPATTEVGGNVTPPPEHYSELCPADTVATGIRVGRYQMDLWKMDITGRVEFICSRISVVRDGGAWRARAEYAGSATGGVGSKQTFESFCAEGSVLTGFHGGAGAAIDKLGARCSPLTLQQ